MKTLFLPVLIALLCCNHACGQSGLHELHREIVPKIHEHLNNRNYELDEVRFLSVMISKDSIYIFQNDFSKTKTKVLNKILLELKQNQKEWHFTSIVVSNSNLSLNKEVVLQNHILTFKLLSKMTKGFFHSFTNLNEDISTVY